MRRREEGVILLVAIVALILLSLVAIRQFRSVDVSSMLAGNLAFRQASVQAADRGIQAAAAWLFAPGNAPLLSDDQPAKGYFSAVPAPEPNWMENAAWGTNKSVELAKDEASQRVEYVIHRLCRLANTPPNDSSGGTQNDCVTGSPTTVSSGSSRRVGGNPRHSVPQVQYRVTVRVRGTRGSVAVTQTMLLGPG